jgi:DNA-3-methyladenine glycosylase
MKGGGGHPCLPRAASCSPEKNDGTTGSIHVSQRVLNRHTLSAGLEAPDLRPPRWPTRQLMKKLLRSFYDRNTVLVARELLGKLLVYRTGKIERIGKIVEVEAYLGPRDLAAHSSKGLTERTKVMFGPPGFAYVYLIYGVHHCMNVVTESEGNGAAVLLRAIEPVKNISGRTCGPGLLCRAMEIDRRWNAHDLLSDDFFIAEPEVAENFSIVKRPRIGVDYAGVWAKKLLRFCIKDNSFVSRRG